MTGTQNHEGLAGVAAAVEYLAEIGVAAGADRRARLRSAMNAIREYESGLARRLLAGLAERPRFRVWGVIKPDQLAWRAPTVALTAEDRTPQQMAEQLAAREIYSWAGNMYAAELSERLGQEECGGFLRLGLAHYNTAEEVDRTLTALDEW